MYKNDINLYGNAAFAVYTEKVMSKENVVPEDADKPTTAERSSADEQVRQEFLSKTDREKEGIAALMNLIHKLGGAVIDANPGIAKKQ